MPLLQHAKKRSAWLLKIDVETAVRLRLRLPIVKTLSLCRQYAMGDDTYCRLFPYPSSACCSSLRESRVGPIDNTVHDPSRAVHSALSLMREQPSSRVSYGILYAEVWLPPSLLVRR
eukprot:891887-Pyramimonas_sp.AAC.2